VKAAVLTGVTLLLLIPLALLASLVTERTAQRDEAVQSVARGWVNVASLDRWLDGDTGAQQFSYPETPANPQPEAAHTGSLCAV
jgi:hypothetical protein